MADNGRKAQLNKFIDALLMSRNRNARRRGFELIDTNYRTSLFAFIIGLGLRYGRWFSPDDTYQETILTLMEKVEDDEYVPQGHVDSFLYWIARCHVAKFGRQVKRERAVGVEELENVSVDAVDPFKVDGLTRAFWDALDTLTPDEWVVYTKWLDLFGDDDNPPPLSRLIAELYDPPATTDEDTRRKEETRQKDRARKLRDHAREKIRTHLLALGYEL